MLYCHIDIDSIIKVIKEQKEAVRSYIIIHDYYWLSDKVFRRITEMDNRQHSNYLLDSPKICDKIAQLFSSCHKIVHPSKFTFDIYSSIILSKNHIIIPHNDVKVSIPQFPINVLKKNVINIGIFVYLNKYKGERFIRHLESIKTHRNYVLHFKKLEINMPKYTDTEFDSFVKEHDIHCTLLLNEYGETYCYLLTRILNSGLPFLYNNFGSFKERIKSDNSRIKVYEREDDFIVDDNFQLIGMRYKQLLDLIIKSKNSKTCVYEQDNRILYSSKYSNIFATISNHTAILCDAA